MIVYVPIADHGFAFLDTVTMRFVEVGGDQTFSDVTDLREAGGDRRLVEMAEAAVERKPSAGWSMRCRSWWLKAAGYLAQVKTDGKKPGRWSVWLVSPNAGGGWSEVRGGDAPSVEAAQLAAEDALLAIAAEIVGAVGR